MNATDFSNYRLNIPPTDKPRVVVVGGGFAGMNTILSLKKGQFQVVLFDKHNYHTFVPLLYQVATSALEAPSIADAHRQLFQERDDVFFRPMKVLKVNPGKQNVDTLFESLSYDYLVIATGSKPNFFGNDNIAHYSFPLRTLPHALNIRSKIWQNLEKANFATDPKERQKLLNIVIVGGGPTGVEMAGALAELRKYVLPKDFKELDFSQMSIKIVDAADRPLPTMSEAAGKSAEKQLASLGVTFQFDTLVADYDGSTVTYRDGKTEECGMLIWGAGVMGSLIGGLSEESTAHGKYVVDEYCQVKPYENIFAGGDVAWFQDNRFEKGLPGVAQTAIQQGKYIGRHINNTLKKSKSIKPFRYFDKGTMATIGRNKAVADLASGIHLSNFPAWIIWAFVHLFSLSATRNRVITAVNWTLNYFRYQNKVRLIINPYHKEEDEVDRAFTNLNESGK